MGLGIEDYKIKFEHKGNDKTQASICCYWNFNNVYGFDHLKLPESITVITKRQPLLMLPVSCFWCWPLSQQYHQVAHKQLVICPFATQQACCCQVAHGGLLQIFL